MPWRVVQSVARTLTFEEAEIPSSSDVSKLKELPTSRGRPIHLSDGRVIDGPQPVRDGHHLMGFPWVSNQMKVRLKV